MKKVAKLKNWPRIIKNLPTPIRLPSIAGKRAAVWCAKTGKWVAKPFEYFTFMLGRSTLSKAAEK